MGIFDVRCCLSGLSTSWTRTAEEETIGRCSMVLLEEGEAGWLPLTPPVSGWYDQYGAIELNRADIDEHTRHVGQRLDALQASGALVTSKPEEFEREAKHTDRYMDGHSDPRPRVVTWFVHACRRYPQPHLRMNGRRVAPWLFLDDAQTAVASSWKQRLRDSMELKLEAGSNQSASGLKVYCDWLEEHGRAALATYLRLEAQRGPFGEFKTPWAPETLAAFRAALLWAIEQPGGLQPRPDDEFVSASGEDDERYAREAAARDVGLARLVATRFPKLVSSDQLGVLAPYAMATRYAVGDTFEHPTFGVGIVEKLEGEKKIVVLFGAERRTLAHAKS